MAIYVVYRMILLIPVYLWDGTFGYRKRDNTVKGSWSKVYEQIMIKMIFTNF